MHQGPGAADAHDGLGNGGKFKIAPEAVQLHQPGAVPLGVAQLHPAAAGHRDRRAGPAAAAAAEQPAGQEEEDDAEEARIRADRAERGGGGGEEAADADAAAAGRAEVPAEPPLFRIDLVLDGVAGVAPALALHRGRRRRIHRRHG